MNGNELGVVGKEVSVGKWGRGKECSEQGAEAVGQQWNGRSS